MKIDQDKQILTSEQKLGKYNCIREIMKVIFVLVGIAILFMIGYGMYHNQWLVLWILLWQIISLLHLSCYSKMASYQRVWAVIILLFPGLGTLLYFLGGSTFWDPSKDVSLKEKSDLEQSKMKVTKLDDIKNNTNYQIYRNEGIQYFPTGEKFFQDFETEIKKATKSILIEVYILSKGKLFDHILDILEKKAKEGVKVEILADGLGSLLKVSKKDKKRMKEAGIHFLIFKPLKKSKSISDYLLYRDHKKIMIIDEKIAYLGGINISDEYINKKEMYGVWKDGGIKVKGNVVKDLLQMYFKTKGKITSITKQELQKIADSKEEGTDEKKGYHIAFDEKGKTGENFIITSLVGTIYQAKKYLYIVTPYLIPNSLILNALRKMAKEGIDVKVLVPHMADKKIVQYANRSNYQTLLEEGVKIYEYEPGFIHTKYMITEEMAMIGTVNLDYKSFYFNQECMLLSYQTGIEKSIKEDFEKTLQESIFIQEEIWKKRGIFEKCKEGIAHFLTPLL